MENKMFCYQCQETAGCTGCTQSGVCGKKPDVAAMQDLLVYVTKGISAVAVQLRAEGKEVAPAVNHLVTLNLFTTITNANFDKEAIVTRIHATLEVKQELLSQVEHADGLPEAARWTASEPMFAAKAAQVGVLSTGDEDIRSLRELITYGLKGLSAYSKHANALLQEDTEVDAFLQRALAATLDDDRGPGGVGPGDGQIRRQWYGSAGQGQHGGLRQSRNHKSEHWRGHTTRHPGLRP